MQFVGDGLKFIGPEVPYEEPGFREKTDILVATGDEEALPFDANQAAFAQQDEGMLRLTAEADASMADRLLVSFREEAAKRETILSSPSFTLDGALSAGDPEITSADTRIAINSAIMSDVLRTEVLPLVEDKSWLGIGVDFLDRFIARGVITNYEDATLRVERLGQEILEAKARLQPSEFKPWVSNKIAEIREEGVFTSDNLFALGTLLNAVESQGVFPEGDLDQVIAIASAGFGAVTSLPSVVSATKKGAALASAISQARKIAIARGPDAGAEVAEGLVTQQRNADALVDAAPAELDPRNPLGKPSQGAIERIGMSNRLVQKLRRQIATGAGGRIDLSNAGAEAVKFAKRIVSKFDYPVLSARHIEDDLGNVTLYTELGKKKGGVFKTRAAAEKAAARLIESGGSDTARAVPEISGGWKILAEKRVDPATFINPIAPSAEGIASILRGSYSYLKSFFLSSSLRDIQDLSVLALQGESQNNQLRRLFDKEFSVVQKLNYRDRTVLGQITTRIRDGEDSGMRRWYTEDEFIAEYQKRTGFRPDQKVLDAYDSLVTASDAAHFLYVFKNLQRLVQKGYVAVKMGDVHVVAKPVSRDQVGQFDVLYIPKDTVYNLDMLDDLENVRFYQLAEPMPDGTRFIANPSSARALDPRDVAPYNPGGPRTNPDANFFVFASIAGRPIRGLLTAIVRKQSDAAVNQLVEIRRAIREGGDINEAIAKNNDWNPEIEDVEDLRRWLVDQGVVQSSDLDAVLKEFSEFEFVVKPRDTNLSIDEAGGIDAWVDTSAGDYARLQMARNDKAMTNYGGGQAVNDDPISAIQGQYSSLSRYMAMRAYTRQAMVSWVKTAEGLGGVVDFGIYKGSDNYDAMFAAAKIDGTTQEGKRLRELQKIIQRRLNIKMDDYFTWEDAKFRVMEAIYGKPFVGKLTSAINRIDSPESNLLKVGFYTAFWGSIDQFVIQLAHIQTVGFRLGAAKAYKAGALLYLLRSAGQISDPASLELLASRAGKALGYSTEDMMDAIQYFKVSGRAIIDSDIMEEGTGITSAVSRAGNSASFVGGVAYEASRGLRKLGDLGMVPFNTAEKLARMYGMAGGIVRYLDEGKPGGRIMAKGGFDRITWYEQSLNGLMTNASRSQVMTSVGGIPSKLPFQFLSYSMNVFSQVMFDKTISRAERARMLFSLTGFFGATGLGVTSLIPKEYLSFTESMGIEHGSLEYNFLTYGMIDALLNEAEAITGIEGHGIAIGARLAPITAFVEVGRKLFSEDQNLLEVFGGPSGSIINSTFVNGRRAFEQFMYGNYTLALDEVIQILRQPSAIDHTVKAYGILMHGTLSGRSGIPIPGEFTYSDAMTAFLGFNNMTTQEFYSLRSTKLYSDRDVRNFSRWADQRAEMAFTLMARGDMDSWERGKQILTELGVHIEYSPFSQSEKKRIRTSILNKNESQQIPILRWLVDQGLNETAASLAAREGNN